MTQISSAPSQAGSRFAEQFVAEFGELVTPSTSAGGEWASRCVDVPPSHWRAAMAFARDTCGLTFFDWLGAIELPPHEQRARTDEAEAGSAGQPIQVVAHLWSVPERAGLLLRATLDESQPTLSSVVDIFAGAAWHEREAAEMFGIGFPGHAGLRKLLLTDEFSGHPLRKDFVLASRVAKAWPGEKEPGDGAAAAGKARRRMLPPGVPEPGTWPSTDATPTPNGGA